MAKNSETLTAPATLFTMLGVPWSENDSDLLLGIAHASSYVNLDAGLLIRIFDKLSLENVPIKLEEEYTPSQTKEIWNSPARPSTEN